MDPLRPPPFVPMPPATALPPAVNPKVIVQPNIEISPEPTGPEPPEIAEDGSDQELLLSSSKWGI